jgi:hypothetical protein
MFSYGNIHMRQALVKKPSLKHLRVLVSDVYVHVPRENRNKLDNKAKNRIFICYKDGIKGYKLWHLITKKTTYSQNIVFREVNIVPKQEVQPREEEPETTKFDMEGEESNSIEEDEPENEEPQTPILSRLVQERRQPEGIPPLYSFKFCSIYH